MRYKDMTPEEKKEYHRERSKINSALHRTERSEYNRQWRSANPEKMKEIKRVWREKNRDKINAQKRDSAKRNATSIQVRNLAYQRANREKTRAWSKKYYEKNKERYIGYQHTRRALIAGSPGKLSRGIRKKHFVTQNGICFYCPADLCVTGFVLEHKTPLSRGGSNTDENTCLACPACNGSKFTKDAVAFIALKQKIPAG